MARGGLTPRQRAVVAQFLVDLNATAAAIRARYKTSGAAEVASRLVKKSQVSRAIREGMQARAARTRVALRTGRARAWGPPSAILRRAAGRPGGRAATAAAPLGESG